MPGDYRNRTSTDSPERRAAVRASWDLQELKRAARRERLSLRRKRYRVGTRLVYELGERDRIGCYGTIDLEDVGGTAVVTESTLFGVHMTATGPQLASMLPQAAAAARSNTGTIVVLPVEDTLTRPQPVLYPETEAVEFGRYTAAGGVSITIAALPPDGPFATGSIPIPAELIEGEAHDLVDTSTPPESWVDGTGFAWFECILGLVLLLGGGAGLFASLVGERSALTGTVSAVAIIVGVALAIGAVRAHDRAVERRERQVMEDFLELGARHA